MNKIISEKELGEIRKKHKKIVFCTGCYDILHSGHIMFFKQCKQFGETLIVGIGRDSTIAKLKGPDRPINTEQNRLFLVSALQDVDYVILNEKKIRPGKIDFFNIISKLKPDVFVLNDNDSAVKEKRELCNKFNVELKLVPKTVPENLKQISSTDIAENIKHERI